VSFYTRKGSPPPGLWYGPRLVLGQAHTPRRRLLPFAAIALAVLVAPAVGGANPSHTASALRAHDAEIAAKSRSAVLGLYALDQRLAGARSHLLSLRRQTLSLRAQQQELRLQLQIARRGTARAQRQLAARVRALYEQGNVEPIEVLFGSTSLDEAMTNFDNLSRVSSQGKEVLAQLRRAKQRLATASRDLATRASALAAATRDAAATTASLEQAHAQRTAYIASLAAQRRLTKQQLAAVVARAHAAQVRSATIVTAPSTASQLGLTDATSRSTTAGRTIVVSATGYALGGRTSTGLAVGWGVAAVDPSVIPLGTHMTVPGYGDAVAADTGGAVSGASIDLWFPTVAQASAWGRRTVTIVLH
jgi:3D (Asp-Asp-Asp) domain-containing protein